MAYFRRDGDLPDWIPEPHKGHILSWISPPEKDDGICEATWQNVVKARLTRRLNSPMLISLSHKQAVTSLSSSFLAAKKVVFQAGPARRPCGLVAREKIFLTLCVSVFFHGKPCRKPPKNKLKKSTRNKNAYQRRRCIIQKIIRLWQTRARKRKECSTNGSRNPTTG